MEALIEYKKSLPEIETLITSMDDRLMKITRATNELKVAAKNKENDDNISRHIAAFKKACDDIQSQRMPITKRFDDIKRLFTSRENHIKEAVEVLQNWRNDFARIQVKEKEERDRKERLKNEKHLEYVKLKEQASLLLRKEIATETELMVTRMVKALRAVTKDDHKAKMEGLKKMSTQLSVDYFNSLQIKISSRYDNDIDEIIRDVKFKLKDELFKSYSDTIQEAKFDCIHVLEQAFEISDQDIENRINDIKAENTQSLEIAQVKSEAVIQQAETEVILESINEDEDLRIKNSYKIIITNDAQYSAICAFWFASCAKDFTGIWTRKNIGSMIKDLESLALKTGEKVPGIKYEAEYKAK